MPGTPRTWAEIDAAISSGFGVNGVTGQEVLDAIYSAIVEGLDVERIIRGKPGAVAAQPPAVHIIKGTNQKSGLRLELATDNPGRHIEFKEPQYDYVTAYWRNGWHTNKYMVINGQPHLNGDAPDQKVFPELPEGGMFTIGADVQHACMLAGAGFPDADVLLVYRRGSGSYTIPAMKAMRIKENGMMEALIPHHGPILRTADGRRWRLGINETGGNVPALIALDPVIPAAVPAAGLGTLIADFEAAGSAKIIGLWWTGDGSLISQDGVTVGTIDDSTGRAMLPSLDAPTVPERPPWDGANERVNFGGAHALRTRTVSQWLDLQHPLRIYHWGTVPNTGDPMCFCEVGATDLSRYWTLYGGSTEIKSALLGGSNDEVNASVLGSADRRLMYNQLDEDDFHWMQIVDDAATFQDGLTRFRSGPDPTPTGNHLTLGARGDGTWRMDGGYWQGTIVVWAPGQGSPSAAQQTVLRNWLDAKALHAPVYL